MEQTVLIDSIDTAKFECPECSREQIMQLSQHSIKKLKTKVRCKCLCGHTYIVVLTKQLESIQETHLLGTFLSKGKIRCRGKMIIKKLNSRGLMLKTNIEQALLPGLKLFLEFVLDDAKQSIVKKVVIIKAAKGRYLSAEFISNKHYDNLGPYLFFKKLNV